MPSTAGSGLTPSEANGGNVQDSQKTDPTPPLSEVPTPLPVPVGSTTIGAAGGIALEAFGRSGHWFSYCQADANAQAAPLDVMLDIRGNARGQIATWLHTQHSTEKIDALLAHDPHGVFVAILRGSTAELLNTVNGERWPLDTLKPDLRSDRELPHRSFAFSNNGRWLLLLTTTGAQLLDLQAPEPVASARAITLSARPVWRVFASGEQLVLATLPEGSSEKNWPMKAAKTPGSRCQQGTYSAFGRLSGPYVDRSLEYSLIPLPAETRPAARALTPQPAPGFVMGFKRAWVRRTDEGRVLLVEGTRQRQITSSKCGGRILHADERSGYFLIACEEYRPVKPKKRSRSKPRAKPKYRFDLYLIKPGAVRDLQADLMRTGVDLPPSQGPRFVPLRPGSTAALADFTEGRLIRLDAGEVVLTTNDRGALLLDGKQLIHWTPSRRTTLEYKIDGLESMTYQDPAVSVERRVILLDGENVHSWLLPAPPTGITSDGHALVPESAATETRWARGPLHWIPRPTSKNPPAERATPH